jgi:hypothetical protein
MQILHQKQANIIKLSTLPIFAIYFLIKNTSAKKKFKKTADN